MSRARRTQALQTASSRGFGLSIGVPTICGSSRGDFEARVLSGQRSSDTLKNRCEIESEKKKKRLTGVLKYPLPTSSVILIPDFKSNRVRREGQAPKTKLTRASSIPTSRCNYLAYGSFSPPRQGILFQNVGNSRKKCREYRCCFPLLASPLQDVQFAKLSHRAAPCW
jgi:hypothetical protein